MNSLQITKICKILGELLTGQEITIMFANLGINCELPDIDTKWKRIYNGVANECNKNNSYDPMIKIIEYIMSPSLFVERQNDFTDALDSLNTLLSFIGLKLLPTGKVIKVTPATTLDEATEVVSRLKADLHRFSIHPQILAFCRPEIISENLFHLIFESCKCLLAELRSISGLDLDGSTLVNRCFEGSSPIIVMNKFQTDDEKSDHNGLRSLLNAIVYLYRNPKAHTPKYLSNDTYQSTIEALIIISRARYALEKCVRNYTHKIN